MILNKQIMYLRFKLNTNSFYFSSWVCSTVVFIFERYIVSSFDINIAPPPCPDDSPHGLLVDALCIHLKTLFYFIEIHQFLIDSKCPSSRHIHTRIYNTASSHIRDHCLSLLCPLLPTRLHVSLTIED